MLLKKSFYTKTKAVFIYDDPDRQYMNCLTISVYKRQDDDIVFLKTYYVSKDFENDLMSCKSLTALIRLASSLHDESILENSNPLNWFSRLEQKIDGLLVAVSTSEPPLSQEQDQIQDEKEVRDYRPLNNSCFIHTKNHIYDITLFPSEPPIFNRWSVGQLLGNNDD